MQFVGFESITMIASDPRHRIDSGTKAMSFANKTIVLTGASLELGDRLQSPSLSRARV